MWDDVYFNERGKEVSEFMFSDEKLGIFQNEIEKNGLSDSRFIVMNRLEIILMVNRINCSN